jgi:hypothetical protein
MGGIGSVGRVLAGKYATGRGNDNRNNEQQQRTATTNSNNEQQQQTATTNSQNTETTDQHGTNTDKKRPSSYPCWFRADP